LSGSYTFKACTTCTPNCAGKNCGPDGCGGYCVSVACGISRNTCINGVCTPPPQNDCDTVDTINLIYNKEVSGCNSIINDICNEGNQKCNSYDYIDLITHEYGQAIGKVYCDGEWVVDVRRNRWYSECKGNGGLVEDGGEWVKVDQTRTQCVNQICYGVKSKLIRVENGEGHSNEDDGIGPVCCDKDWWINVYGSSWVSRCNDDPISFLWNPC
jgi:hypothetical protein